jgi:hypothetical protein
MQADKGGSNFQPFWASLKTPGNGVPKMVDIQVRSESVNLTIIPKLGRLEK